jgi:hypothetical protein
MQDSENSGAAIPVGIAAVFASREWRAFVNQAGDLSAEDRPVHTYARISRFFE